MRTERIVSIAWIVAVATLLGAAVAPAAAQATRSKQPRAAAAVPQSQQDREWLTAYMMAHHGYHLHHMDALENKFKAMSPTQLGTMRMLYQQKHESAMQGQEMNQRLREHEVSIAEAHNQRTRQQMDQFNRDESRGANLEENRLNMMHREAYENYRTKNYSSMVAPYGYGYGYGPSPYRLHGAY